MSGNFLKDLHVHPIVGEFMKIVRGSQLFFWPFVSGKAAWCPPSPHPSPARDCVAMVTTQKDESSHVRECKIDRGQATG